MKYTVSQYNQVSKKLPLEIRDVVWSQSTNDKLFEIAQRHKLHIDKSGEMINLVLDVMMGMEPAKTFVHDLQRVTE